MKEKTPLHLKIYFRIAIVILCNFFLACMVVYFSNTYDPNAKIRLGNTLQDAWLYYSGISCLILAGWTFILLALQERAKSKLEKENREKNV